MTDKEGTLAMQANGRWAIVNPDWEFPVELTSGTVFRVAVAGREGLSPTRMEFHWGTKAYYSWDGYPLATGLKAASGDGA